ncbi:hypothetical protein [Micromonospora luteifusca]|uniref:hypothetical protein n=1 Tax=Micromonospora luteifusca TaxID=709860 RepID=UPI0033B87CCF
MEPAEVDRAVFGDCAGPARRAVLKASQVLARLKSGSGARCRGLGVGSSGPAAVSDGAGPGSVACGGTGHAEVAGQAGAVGVHRSGSLSAVIPNNPAVEPSSVAGLALSVSSAPAAADPLAGSAGDTAGPVAVTAEVRGGSAARALASVAAVGVAGVPVELVAAIGLAGAAASADAAEPAVGSASVVRPDPVSWLSALRSGVSVAVRGPVRSADFPGRVTFLVRPVVVSSVVSDSDDEVLSGVLEVVATGLAFGLRMRRGLGVTGASAVPASPAPAPHP